MTQDEYILTSSDEAQSLAEQGRRLTVTLADEAIADALRSFLWYVWDAERDGDIFDEERQSAIATVDTHLARAQQHLQVACQSTRFERDRYSYVRNIFGVVHQSHAPFGSGQWNTLVRAAINSYKACQDGHSLTALTAFYEATDPALPEDYAKELVQL